MCLYIYIFFFQFDVTMSGSPDVKLMGSIERMQEPSDTIPMFARSSISRADYKERKRGRFS